MVELLEDMEINPYGPPNDHSVWDICDVVGAVGNKTLVDGHKLPVDGLSGNDFSYNYNASGNNITGWEASMSFEGGMPHALQIKVETQVKRLEEKSSMARCLMEPPDIPIPEFPTIALPIAAILGLMFILQSRRRRED